MALAVFQYVMQVQVMQVAVRSVKNVNKEVVKGSPAVNTALDKPVATEAASPASASAERAPSSSGKVKATVAPVVKASPSASVEVTPAE